jgi:uracil-DNA glycosylase
MYGKKYWSTELGEDWAMVLKPFLKDPYMQKLMHFLNIQYAMNDIYPANYKSIFDAFKYCPWNNLRVVIIGTEPNRHSGLGPLSFSDITTLSQNPAAYEIRNCVERVYGQLNLEFDFTFESWARQGVLMLNRSLTCPADIPQGHKKQWKKFFGSILYQIVAEKPGTIFLLWGKEAQKYSEILSFNQHVFSWEHPMKAALEYRTWDCPNFKQVDTLLEHLYGRDSIIKW